MPDEKDEQSVDPEKATPTPLHAHGEGRDEEIEGEIGGGEDEGAETAVNTGGATSGGPGGHAHGEDDPSNVEHDPPEDSEG